MAAELEESHVTEQAPLNAGTGVLSTDTTGPYVAQTHAFLDGVFARFRKRDFAFRLWDGSQWTPSGFPTGTTPRFTVTLTHPGSLRAMFLPPSDARLGRAYTLGHFDISGDAGGALDLGRHLWESWGVRDVLYNAVSLLRLPSGDTGSFQSPDLSGSGAVHSQARDLSAVQFHYDVSNDFYKMWLDKRMVYSCAYFATGTESIDDAQFAKLNMLCTKLRMCPGDTLLDVGCGWGALIIHAASHFGVRAIGVTLSDAQVTEARARIKAAGLSDDQCSAHLRDYRDLPGLLKDLDLPHFDHIVSVGMVEHVGRDNLREYFRALWNALRPGGCLMNHGICLLHDKFASRRQIARGFFATYIFPDGDLQPLQYVLDAAAKEKWEVRDVDGLREHYGLTLDHWLARFEAHENDIVNIVGRETYRLWKLYLLGAGWGFKVGLHALYQTLLYKADPDTNGSSRTHLPLTREDWYAKDSA